MTPAEQIAFWSDKLRDMAATGLKYAQNICDLANMLGIDLEASFAAKIEINKTRNWHP